MNEQNDARLIEAAMGKKSLPSPEAKQRALRLLKAEQAMLKSADFPVSVLGILAGMLGFLTFLLGLRSVGLIGWGITSVPLAIATWLVYANLVTVPVAGVLIIIRRRAC